MICLVVECSSARLPCYPSSFSRTCGFCRRFIQSEFVISAWTMMCVFTPAMTKIQPFVCLCVALERLRGRLEIALYGKPLLTETLAHVLTRTCTRVPAQCKEGAEMAYLYWSCSVLVSVLLYCHFQLFVCSVNTELSESEASPSLQKSPQSLKTVNILFVLPYCSQGQFVRKFSDCPRRRRGSCGSFSSMSACNQRGYFKR